MASKMKLFCTYLVFALKTKLLTCHCTGYGYFKDSSAVYLDPLCFDLAVARPNKKYNNNNNNNNNNKKKKKKKKKKEIFGYFTKCRKL